MVEQDYSALERQLKLTQDELVHTYDERDTLQTQVDRLSSQLELAAESDVKALLSRYIVLRTPDNHRRRGKDELDFVTWQNGIEEPHKKKISILQSEVEALRKVHFRTRMNLFMSEHKEFEEIPFAYCDVNGQLLCTRSVYDLFSIDYTKQLNLNDLFEHIDREDSKFIFESFKTGTRLKDYKLKDVRSISLYTYPLFYSELPVGVAMLLISPEIEIPPNMARRFVRQILHEVRDMSQEYKVLKYNAKNSEKTKA